jgi:hypothetical protein
MLGSAGGTAVGSSAFSALRRTGAAYRQAGDIVREDALKVKFAKNRISR